MEISKFDLDADDGTKRTPLVAAIQYTLYHLRSEWLWKSKPAAQPSSQEGVPHALTGYASTQSLRNRRNISYSELGHTAGKVTGRVVASFHSSYFDIIPVESLYNNDRCIMVYDDIMHEKVQLFILSMEICIYYFNYLRRLKHA